MCARTFQLAIRIQQWIHQCDFVHSHVMSFQNIAYLCVASSTVFNNVSEGFIFVQEGKVRVAALISVEVRV